MEDYRVAEVAWGDSNAMYGSRWAYVLSSYNVEVVGKKIVLPVYMTMFLKNAELPTSIYKLDLAGL